MIAGTLWSPHDDEALRRFHGAHPPIFIAKHMGRSEVAVRNRISLLNLRGNPRRPTGFTKNQIAWAETHRSNPEARMILAMMGEDLRKGAAQ